MEALATFTSQRDVAVAKNVIDQLIHCWFLELAPGASLAAKSSGSFDLFFQKLTNIYPCFSVE
jgi:hypothetical protein